MTDQIDSLLAAPLAEPSDQGFSSRVMAGVANIQYRRARREAVLSLVAIGLAILIAWLSPVGPALAEVARVITSTPAVSLGFVVLMFSGLIYARVRA